LIEVGGHQISLDGRDAIVEIDESIYEAPAVLRAAYWMTDRAYVLIQRPEPGKLVVRVRAKRTQPSLKSPKVDDPLELAGELANALLDHQLREEVARRTAGVRQLILERALADNGAFDDDPDESAGDPVAQGSGQLWPPR
jgi:His-Xaa-Ser system protein HxsD